MYDHFSVDLRVGRNANGCANWMAGREDRLNEGDKLGLLSNDNRMVRFRREVQGRGI